MTNIEKKIKQAKITINNQDDFSMDFAEWLGENEFTMFSNGFWYSGFGRACTTKELLEIYKEELWNTKKK